ncbi:alpha/beta fold hydrolase [Microbacterium rhizophilus]|uniref:alpha/beta fold hydrolase n=1 Tax=Microbacterium rhizophilus TaxID=3138934 RepID=UPI0031EAB8B6
MIRRHRGLVALATAAALGLSALVGIAAPATAADQRAASDRVTAQPAAELGRHGPGHSKPKPTVVLVHGAFADASGWSKVAAALQAEGYPVLAFANPLRGPAFDGEYLRQFLATITGPIVLVGHSYGGAVITNGATGSPNVKSLVYIAAYAPDQGETVAASSELGGGHSTVTEHLVVRPFPGAGEGDADAYIDPAVFPELFAQDVPKQLAKTMAASQRPAAFAALVTPSGIPAWETIPSWYMVAKNDRIIPPEAERFMAERAGATTVEVRTSHVPMISASGAVVSLIRAAAR